MDRGLSIGFFWSKPFLTSRGLLWGLFWINLLGTLYGYEWYWNQMVQTISEKPIWMVLYVPDSPTASLFFTWSVAYLLADRGRTSRSSQGRRSWLRSLVETVAVITSFKYGVWAVSIIVASVAQGDPAGWQDWMLGVSHLGMAVEALLYIRFFRLSNGAFLWGAAWVISNDYVDYVHNVYPWLPDSLEDDVTVIGWLTFALSLFSWLLMFALYKYLGRRPV